MNIQIDLGTIPTSPLSPEWEVPTTTSSPFEPCGHSFVFKSSATETELGRTIKEVAIQFSQFMEEDPSLEATQDFLRHWIDTSTNKIPPMVLEWMENYEACAIAAENYRMDLIQVLLRCGFKLDHTVVFNLVEAAKKSGDIIETLEFITENGWDLNALTGGIGNRRPVLCLVVEDEAAVKWCLDRGADPNGMSVHGVTVLHCAARNASLSTLKMLLSAGGDISATSPSSGILVHAVASYPKKPDRRVIIEYLINRVDVNALFMQPKEGSKRSHLPWAGHQTALHLAVNDGNRDLVEYLLKHGASTQLRVFGPASRHKWMSVVRLADSHGHENLRDLLDDSAPGKTSSE
ncbi:unnamed protein product [Periconia digitata]|uniref:Uncharacterized protein n=1 Tax=Periconia digitata TaxID=1303443 RepID=A0A9W4XJZ4_9PLEO|nr:unnamed protein product [Periconia digitata]